MSFSADHYPVAISRISENDSREAQNLRAIRWLLSQDGGPVVVVTPRAQFLSESIKRLIARRGVIHLTWRGFSVGTLSDHRVFFGWPDRKHLNDLWDATPDALVVVEHGGTEASEWIEDFNPVQLLMDGTMQSPAEPNEVGASLPDDVASILEHVAQMAAGYSSGLKWNEEEKLKADMMNRPERWKPVTVEQVRIKCRALKMRPHDVDTIAEYVQRRKDGRRFNVRGTYRSFEFN